jgi:glycerol-3-phosphate dehydrogenase
MPGLAVDLVGGAHLELEGELRRGVYYTEAPSDRRAVFAIPWRGRILVGTTETPWSGDPGAVEPTPAELDYLEAVFRRYFPGRDARRVASWAGLRVLPRGGGRAFDRPRETTLVVDDARAPRALAIYGGKLTGYRATAEKVVARLAPSLPARARRADTRTLRLQPARDAGARGSPGVSPPARGTS